MTTFKRIETKGNTYEVFRDGISVGTAYTNFYTVYSCSGEQLTNHEKFLLIAHARKRALL